jgi:predicted lipid carrier protein YhbT
MPEMQSDIRNTQENSTIQHRSITTAACYVLLSSLKTFVRSVPDTIHQHALSRFANLVLSDECMRARLAPVEGRCLCLAVVDANARFQFEVHSRRLRPVSAARVPDVLITGKLIDFLLVATRAEDPDTLFFSRRLSLEGETETGLHVKNLIDSMDIDLNMLLHAALGERAGDFIATTLSGSVVERRVEMAARTLVDVLRAMVANDGESPSTASN